MGKFNSIERATRFLTPPLKDANKSLGEILATSDAIIYPSS
jgi:hypothetical protein